MKGEKFYEKNIFIFAYVAISYILLIGCSVPSSSILRTEKENISKETTLKESVLSRMADTTDWKLTAYETINNFNGISMSVEKETLTANGLTIIFQNTSDKLCMFGD